VGDIKVPENLPDRQETLFNREEQSRITEGVPGEKFTLNLDYRYKFFRINVRNTYYGEVGHKIGEVDPETGVSPLDQNYGAKVLTDAELRINATERLQFKVGGNNILDVYPDENKEIKQDNGRFPYNTAVTQFGFNGAFFYAGLNIRL
jgi:iron complex outermembrane receptor protein